MTVCAPLSANDEITLREWCRDGVLGARLSKLSMAQAVVDLLATVDQLRAENACVGCADRIAAIARLEKACCSALDAMGTETLRAVVAEERLAEAIRVACAASNDAERALREAGLL